MYGFIKANIKMFSWHIMDIFLSPSIQFYLKVNRNGGFFAMISWVCCTCLGGCQNCVCDGLKIMLFGEIGYTWILIHGSPPVVCWVNDWV